MVSSSARACSKLISSTGSASIGQAWPPTGCKSSNLRKALALDGGGLGGGDVSASAAFFDHHHPAPPPPHKGEGIKKLALERVLDTGNDLVADIDLAGLGRRQRRLGVAGVLLALGAQLLDQRRPVAVESGAGRGLHAGRLLRLGEVG